jgi:hypothetical protein
LLIDQINFNKHFFQELPWFCPSVLIYLASIIPAIWILELKTNRREILCSYIKLVRDGGEGDAKRFNMLLDLMQVCLLMTS